MYAGAKKYLFSFCDSNLIAGGKMVKVILAEKKIEEDMYILGQSLHQHILYKGSG